MLSTVLQPLKFAFFFLSFLFLGPHAQHMYVPRLGGQLELQPPAYTAIAVPDLSHACNPHHSSWQHQIPYPLSEARDQTRNLMVPSQIHFCCTMKGTPITVPLQYLLNSERVMPSALFFFFFFSQIFFGNSGSFMVPYKF